MCWVLGLQWVASPVLAVLSRRERYSRACAGGLGPGGGGEVGWLCTVLLYSYSYDHGTRTRYSVQNTRQPVPSQQTLPSGRESLTYSSHLVTGSCSL